MMNEFEKGIGIAGYLLSISIFASLINKQIFTTDEVLKIIDGSRQYAQHPELFAGAPKTLASADAALGAVQGLLTRLTTVKASA